MTTPSYPYDKYGNPVGRWSTTPPPQVGQLTQLHCGCCSKKMSSMKLASGTKWWWWHIIAICAISMNFLMLLVVLGLTAFVVHQVR